MRTHIIQLEPYDDIDSIRDKMSWGRTGRILLVWPNRDERVLFRRLDVLLLHRRSVELGARLALVTKDPDVQYYAKELFIPVFKNTRQAQIKSWRHRGRSKLPFLRTKKDRNHQKLPNLITLRSQIHLFQPWNQNPLVRVISFTVGVLAVLAIWAMIYPSARITILPELTTHELTFTAITGPSINTVNPSGAIPTRLVSVIVEGSTSVETTGTIEIPDTPARGTVRFTNLTDVAVVIPEGTVISTDTQPPIRFRTTRSGRISAEAGGTVDISIEALFPGSEGNVAQELIRTIEGPLGLQLTVINSEPTLGGSEQTLAAPTQLDRRRAYRKLLDSLRESAISELQASIAPGDLLLSETPFLLNTLEESYFPPQENPSDVLDATVRLEFQTHVLADEDLLNLGKMVLDTRMPEGFSGVEGTLSVDLLSKPELDRDAIGKWSVHASQKIQPEISKNQILNLILGKTTQQARDQLENTFSISGTPEIEIFPNWWPRMPWLPYRIEVLIGNQANSDNDV